MKILVVGSINMDLTTYVDKLPLQGETKFGNSFIQCPGGKGANQAVASSLAGGDVTMLGAIGNDANGISLKNILENKGVKLKLKVDENVTTGCASILIEEELHDNRIIVVPGANFSLTKEVIDENIDLIKETDIVISQLEIPLKTVEYLGEICKKYQKIFILNPAPGTKLPESLLKNVTYLTPNETELKLITGEEDIETSIESLLSLGVEKVLVTLGKKGVYYADKKMKKMFPAHVVQAIDTTAAGDCFNGTFAAFISKGKSIEESIDLAQVASSICVRRKGAISSLPTIEEIIK